MGGDREYNALAKTESSQDSAIGSLRIHESDKEVHFHDDANKLKVAVPSADMFSAWEKLSSGRKNKFKYVDRANGTELRIEIIKLKRKKRAALTDALFRIRSLKKNKMTELPQIEGTPEFQKFDEFIKG